jgi:hypothetical protein
MAAAKNKNKKKPWKMGTSSGHITNLKQSILETFNIYNKTSWLAPALGVTKFTIESVMI